MFPRLYGMFLIFNMEYRIFLKSYNDDNCFLNIYTFMTFLVIQITEGKGRGLPLDPSLHAKAIYFLFFFVPFLRMNRYEEVRCNILDHMIACPPATQAILAPHLTMNFSKNLLTIPFGSIYENRCPNAVSKLFLFINYLRMNSKK